MLSCVVNSRRHPRRASRHHQPLPKWRFPSPFFSSPSALFQVPYPASPLFATLTKTAGCIPTLPNSELPPHFSCSVSPALSPHLVSFHDLAHSVALFCTQKKLNSFLFKRFRTLRQKTQLPGVGVPPLSPRRQTETPNCGLQRSYRSERPRSPGRLA